MAAAAAGVVLATALFEVNNSFLITDFSTRSWEDQNHRLQKYSRIIKKDHYFWCQDIFPVRRSEMNFVLGASINNVNKGGLGITEKCQLHCISL